MANSTNRYVGGCLCGALRYAAEGKPLFAGLCFCVDCRKASGSGFVPYLGFAAADVRFTGASVSYVHQAVSGGDATRNSCLVCNGLVFGGERDVSESFTIYAGSLDDVSTFHPTVAIFTSGRPDWAVIPPGLKIFERAPG
jgi:hypothetical protein